MENTKPPWILLTLERHKDGIWISHLVKALHTVDPTAIVDVVTLESLLDDPNLIATITSPKFQGCRGLINRVSDAAEPHLYKACVSMLNLWQQLFQVPIWNGPQAYALCGNKWCHHALFEQAGLSCPPTQTIYQPTPMKFQQTVRQMQDNDKDTLGKLPQSYLLKPNAGGFGAGIVKLDSDSLSSSSSSSSSSIVLPLYTDEMALCQNYMTPRNGVIYRVWFLCGAVQCGMVRSLPNSKSPRSDHVASTDEFTRACAGSMGGSGTSCTRSSSTTTNDKPTSHQQGGGEFLPWEVPLEVKFELENRLLPLLPDAHCGSVEFLYDKDDPHPDQVGGHGCRLYFDLNLLSTLPIVEHIPLDVRSLTWTTTYDPWIELAQAICDNSQSKP